MKNNRKKDASFLLTSLKQKFQQRGNCLIGFSLTEILVAILIFVIISITLGGVIIQMTELQRAITNRNQQISELRFVLDYISNSISNAQNPPMTGCITLANANFETIAGPGIRFINADNRCQEVFLSPLIEGFGRIQTRISTDHTSVNLAASINLTSDVITIFNINLIGNIIGPADGQPRITVFIGSNIRRLDLPMTVQRTISRIKLDR